MPNGSKTPRRTKVRQTQRRTISGADRSRALTLALASFAHEVRTPLNGILAFSEMLLGAKLDASARDWAQAVHSAAQHLERLTTTVVDGARAGERGLVLRDDDFSPRQLADEMAAIMRARALAAGLPFEVHIAQNLPDAASGDAVRLRAAIENLIDNAVKFAMGRGVRFSAAWTAESRTRGRLIVDVSDNGAGLSRAACARLFRPFGQADAATARRYAGAGLGLFFSRNVARAMGGDLTAESAPGRGCTFRLIVQVRAASAERLQRSQPMRPAGAKALRVLCAEDNAHGRKLLASILSALGHKAIFVEDGEAAAARASAKPADVILLDVTMTGLDGFETARRIRAFTGAAGRVPIIGLSGHDGDDHVRSAQAAGMNAYLVKPVTPQALAAALTAVTATRAGAKRGGRSRRSPAAPQRR